jgi:hypothetical protein
MGKSMMRTWILNPHFSLGSSCTEHGCIQMDASGSEDLHDMMASASDVMVNAGSS